jgi:hypothetical protein
VFIGESLAQLFVPLIVKPLFCTFPHVPLTIKQHTPTVGKDWNDQLQSLQRERNNELSKAAQAMGMGIVR